MAIKVYDKQFKQVLPKIYEVNQQFLNAFGGTIQVKDGVSNSDFLTLKTTDTDVVIQKYDTSENVGFGTGTGKSSRFGDRKEIKSVDKTVKYEEPLAIHEGIDNFTVNDIPEQVIAERAILHAEKWTEHISSLLSKTISENASHTLKAELTEDGVVNAFTVARKTMLNYKVSKNITKRAYVTTDVYNLIVESKLATTSKQSGANIDNQEILKFKGFIVEEIADEYFQKDDNIYFVADNVGVVGVGIEVYRVLDSEDFYGVAIQGAAKYGKYIPEDNKKAIIKAQLTGGENKLAGVTIDPELKKKENNFEM